MSIIHPRTRMVSEGAPSVISFSAARMCSRKIGSSDGCKGRTRRWRTSGTMEGERSMLSSVATKRLDEIIEEDFISSAGVHLGADNRRQCLGKWDWWCKVWIVSGVDI